MLKISLTFIAVAALLVGVAACGSSTVKQSSEVDLMNKVLQAKGAKGAINVDCPSDTDAKEGETFTCTADLPSGQTVTMDAKVTSINGDTAHLQATGLHVTKGG